MAETESGAGQTVTEARLQNRIGSRRRGRRLEYWGYRVALVVGDIVALCLAFAASFWMRFEIQLSIHPEVVPPVELYLQCALVGIPIWLAVLASFGAYDEANLLRGTEEYARASNACTVSILLLVWATFLFPEFVVARGWLILLWVDSVLLVCTGRFLLRRAARSLRRRGWFLARTILVASEPEAWELARNLGDSVSTGFELVGYVCDSPPSSDQSPLPYLGGLDRLGVLAQDCGIDELVVSTVSLNSEQLLGIFQLGGASPEVGIHFSTGLFELMTSGLRVQTVSGVPLAQVKALRLAPAERFVKRILDVAVAFVLLVLLSPAIATLIILVKLDSTGPAFYRRRVLGLGGTEFAALKFRTMRVDGDRILSGRPDLADELKVRQKLENDPRVTRLGRFLRRYSLDELPQLLAVLAGKMSLVGPRMITREELEKYGALQRNLLSVKPGLTGLWQVSGRSDLSYEERVRLDMHYIRNYSFWRDLHILFIQTLPVVLGGRGAR